MKMKCPTNEFISKVVRLLDEEPSYQGKDLFWIYDSCFLSFYSSNL